MPQLRSILVEDRPELLEEAVSMREDLLSWKARPGVRSTRWIAHPGGEIADDQHRRVTGVLELPELAKDHRPSEGDRRCRRVEPELDPQGPAERELAFEPVGGHHLRCSRDERGKIDRLPRREG